MSNSYLEYIGEYKIKYMKCHKDNRLDMEFFLLDVSRLMLDYSIIREIVPSDRFNKLIRLKNETDRKLLFGAEILLQDGCNKYGLKYKERNYNEYGKPYITNSDIFFNISHSGKFALCCFSKRRNGCDIQLHGEALIDIAKRFFNEEETKLLLSISDEKKRKKFFYDMWVLKESFIKCEGKGLSLGLKGYFFNDMGNNYYNVEQNINKNKYECKLLEEEEYSIAVCIAVG